MGKETYTNEPGKKKKPREFPMGKLSIAQQN